MIRAIGLAALAFILGSAPANATASCTLANTGVVFGTFSGSQVTITGTITMHCTGTGSSNYTLKLSAGNSGTYTARQLKNGANSLSYNLYTDATFTPIWGDGTGGSTNASGKIVLSPPPSVDIVTTIYGKIPTQALPSSGTYTDTIVATLTCTSGGACTTTTSIPVTVNPQPACSISASDLSFGNYAGAQLNGQSAISVTCANSTPWNVGLNQGTTPGGTITARKMKGAGNSTLSYSLFQDAKRTLNWGNTVGTDTVSGTGTGSQQTVPVYGQMPAAQNSAPGAYTDVITATITF